MLYSWGYSHNKTSADFQQPESIYVIRYISYELLFAYLDVFIYEDNISHTKLGLTYN